VSPDVDHPTSSMGRLRGTSDRFSLSFNYELPARAVDRRLGVSATSIYQSGSPFTVFKRCLVHRRRHYKRRCTTGISQRDRLWPGNGRRLPHRQYSSLANSRHPRRYERHEEVKSIRSPNFVQTDMNRLQEHAHHEGVNLQLRFEFYQPVQPSNSSTSSTTWSAGNFGRCGPDAAEMVAGSARSRSNRGQGWPATAWHGPTPPAG